MRRRQITSILRDVCSSNTKPVCTPYGLTREAVNFSIAIGRDHNNDKYKKEKTKQFVINETYQVKNLYEMNQKERIAIRHFRWLHRIH